MKLIKLMEQMADTIVAMQQSMSKFANATSTGLKDHEERLRVIERQLNEPKEKA